MNLIDKDALVAEIERRTDELWALIPDGEKVISDKHTKEDAFNLGKYTALESLDKFIDTLEVKDVDLDFQLFAKEMAEVFALPASITENTEENPLNWEYAIAKHFFELGVKAKQG